MRIYYRKRNESSKRTVKVSKKGANFLKNARFFHKNALFFIFLLEKLAYMTFFVYLCRLKREYTQNA